VSVSNPFSVHYGHVFLTFTNRNRLISKNILNTPSVSVSVVMTLRYPYCKISWLQMTNIIIKLVRKLVVDISENALLVLFCKLQNINQEADFPTRHLYYAYDEIFIFKKIYFLIEPIRFLIQYNFLSHFRDSLHILNNIFGIVKMPWELCISRYHLHIRSPVIYRCHSSSYYCV